MFNQSRRNLARWFTLSMGSILVLFAGVIYQIEVKDKLEALDRLLYDKTRVMAASVYYEVRQNQNQVDLSHVSLLGSGSHPLAEDLIYVRCYNAQGRLVRFFWEFSSRSVKYALWLSDSSIDRSTFGKRNLAASGDIAR